MQCFLVPRSDVSNTIQADFKATAAVVAVVANWQMQTKSDVCAKKARPSWDCWDEEGRSCVHLCVEKDVKGVELKPGHLHPQKHYSCME